MSSRSRRQPRSLAETALTIPAGSRLVWQGPAGVDYASSFKSLFKPLNFTETWRLTQGKDVWCNVLYGVFCPDIDGLVKLTVAEVEVWGVGSVHLKLEGNGYHLSVSIRNGTRQDVLFRLAERAAFGRMMRIFPRALVSD